jgi:hypothetical protein
MMRAIERLTLRRKLASLGSAFPHDNDTMIFNIAHIYMDVIEFSRSIYNIYQYCGVLIEFLPDLDYIPNPLHGMLGSYFCCK